MKIGRIGSPGNERPVAMGRSGRLVDLSGMIDDVTPDVLEDGLEGIRDAVDADRLPSAPHNLRFGAPVQRPPKLLCIGLNYREHAAESGVEPPGEPVVFAKMTNTVVGPDDIVLRPRGSTNLDYEVELAVVIGKQARYLDSPDDAGRVIAGYAISNDVSERHFQLERGGQWMKGKSCETFNPLGPFLVTPDDVDPQNLTLSLSVNGQVRQSGHTSDMIFDVDHIVWYLSQFLVLEPGDVINTGTPSGVALGSPDIGYLAPGDSMKLSISGLGEQQQEVASA